MVCRLAQGVRSREEPEETFLKGVPVDPGRLEIIYPVSADAPAVMVAKSSTIGRMAGKAAEIMHHSFVLTGKCLNDSVRLAERLPPKICEEEDEEAPEGAAEPLDTANGALRCCFWIR